MSTPRTGPGGFWAWLVGGAALTFLGLSLPSALVIGFPLAALLAAALSWRRWLPGYLLGSSLPLLWVAWTNRDGREFVTDGSGTGGGGHELLDPLPWLLVGLGLLALSALLLLLDRWRSRRRERVSAPDHRVGS